MTAVALSAFGRRPRVAACPFSDPTGELPERDDRKRPCAGRVVVEVRDIAELLAAVGKTWCGTSARSSSGRTQSTEMPGPARLDFHGPAALARPLGACHGPEPTSSGSSRGFSAVPHHSPSSHFLLPACNLRPCSRLASEAEDAFTGQPSARPFGSDKVRMSGFFTRNRREVSGRLTV